MAFSLTFGDLKLNSGTIIIMTGMCLAVAIGLLNHPWVSVMRIFTCILGAAVKYADGIVICIYHLLFHPWECITLFQH